MKPTLPSNRVSRNPKAPPIKSVRMAIIHVEAGYVTCNCNWSKVHHRDKVLTEAAQRHLDKKHGGQGLWL